MELTPATIRTARTGVSAECRCPPGTAQYHESTSCYKLYEQGPCDVGQFFAPINEPANIAIMYVICLHFQLNFQLNCYRFQTKETARVLQSIARVSQWNVLLASRFQMLHAAYEGSLSKRQTIRNGQKSIARMQGNYNIRRYVLLPNLT